MGTRADFYAGKDESAEWLGSIAWDGDSISGYIKRAKTEDIYRRAVAAFLATRDDATLPEQGWPWPWNDSGTSDCHYWFFEGKSWRGLNDRHGSEVYVPMEEDYPDDDDAYEKWLEGRQRIKFPDMSSRKKVTLGPRSGLIVLGG